MIAIFRIIGVVVYSIVLCICGTIYCLLTPKNPRNVYVFGQLFGKLSRFLGIKIFVKGVENKPATPCIYIANHQSNYDLLIAAPIFQEGTVTVGKKSLFWVPFFGILYWLTGNILIDRNNKSKAHEALRQVVKNIKKRKVSIWMFPEGTRSQGQGLLSFKSGAFHAALIAGVPLVPVCISNTYNKVKLNRWDNGYVLMEMLEPIDTSVYSKSDIRALSELCRQRMQSKIDELNDEVAKLEQKTKCK